jgi:hypothetical protein
MDNSNTYNPPSLPPYPDSGSGHSVASAPEWGSEPIMATVVDEPPPVEASPLVYDTNPLQDQMRAGPGGGGGEWVQVQDTITGRFYWYNSFTMETTWQNPQSSTGMGYEHAPRPARVVGMPGTAPHRIHNNINNNYGRGQARQVQVRYNGGQIFCGVCCGCIIVGIIISALTTHFSFSVFKTDVSNDIDSIGQ